MDEVKELYIYVDAIETAIYLNVKSLDINKLKKHVDKLFINILKKQNNKCYNKTFIELVSNMYRYFFLYDLKTIKSVLSSNKLHEDVYNEYIISYCSVYPQYASNLILEDGKKIKIEYYFQGQKVFKESGDFIYGFLYNLEGPQPFGQFIGERLQYMKLADGINY